MPATLPSKIVKLCGVLAICAGCHNDPPPVAPGDPIPAPAEVKVDTMDTECAGLINALVSYGDCPNNDEDDKEWATRVSESARDAFDAGKKGHPDEQSQHVIALACHKAAESVKNANERCHAGPKPKATWGR